MRKFLLSLFAFFLFSLGLYAQTTLKGTVKGPDGMGLISAQVQLLKGDEQVKGAVTDFDGNYIMTNIDGGTYSVQVTYLGLATEKINGVIVRTGSITDLDFNMKEDSEVLEDVVITDYRVPLINFDETESSKTLSSEGMKNLGLKSVTGIATTTAGASQSGNGDISIRGSRSSGTNYYVDGFRVSGLIPVSEIEQMQVITGGLSVEYGDVTGGVISLTSKGPSSKFSGAVELETSEFLDPYGYNFGSVSLSGPIIKTKAKEGAPRQTILGFRVAAQALFQMDDRPSRVGVYRMPEDIIEDLEENPVYVKNGAVLPRAELLGKEVLPEPIDARPNEESLDIDLTGKLDLRISKAIDMSVSGIYSKDKDRFTPGNGWGLLNYVRNPYDLDDQYRYNVRWRHKIGRQDVEVDEDEKGKTLFRNASYTLQGGVETSLGLRQDVEHEDNFFQYGQYGTVERTSTPAVGLISDPAEWNGSGMICLDPESQTFCFDHNGYSVISENFVAKVFDNTSNELVDSPNPVLAKYQNINGRLLGSEIDVWGRSYFDNVGRVYNTYRKYKTDRTTVNFNAQLDILPGSSIENRHNVKIGAMYESRKRRRYSINPRELWTLARDAANSHFVAGVNTNLETGDSIDMTINGILLNFPVYGRLIEEDESKLFYKAIREQLGLGINDWVNIDGSYIDASELSLDMFSAGELINYQDLGLDYYGYDYLGNEIDGYTFNDFFTATDDDKRKLYPVAALNPVYISGYLQDKFNYKDIILRVGVRAEYFDANTKVAKDPYSLYPIQTASEFAVSTGQDLPDVVGDEYKVYVDGPESTDVFAYRKDDQWYDKNGTATEGNLLFQGQVFPAYKFENNDITSPDFDPENSFEDYDPTFNLTPRISLSFPISESAGFFAHYDELVQRPPSNTTFTALDYYFFNDPGRLNPNGDPANNPNLKPEKTVDYEVGFQQKLTDNSALKLSVYYRENRDMIQSRYYKFVAITAGEYKTYGNIDFGTVKGFTVGYDFRRTNNLQFNVSYSLQYAEGTGSSSNSGLNTSNGLVRVLVPLSFDERHRIVGNFDYRYESGDRYTGPRVMGYNIFANAGLNVQLATVSGRPYTKLANPNSPFDATGYTGDINGARLPWTFNIDARLDKNITLFANEGRRGVNLNIYLRAANLLNSKNVLGVYQATGSPDDDGYLSSSYGQDAVRNIQETGKDVQNFLAAYEWAKLTPGFYALPRRLYLGAIIEF